MTEAGRKAFDFAQETTKQLLTLATAIFALTFTFLDDVVAQEKAKDAIEWLHRAWGLYLLSILFGIFTLMMLAGNLEKRGQPSIYAGNIVFTAILQIVAFLVALGFTALFGIKAI